MADAGADMIAVEVVYALPEDQTVIALRVPRGSTLRQALVASRVAIRFPEIDLDLAQAGIFGTRKPLWTVLDEGDRIEIYRPLRADPKQARRSRARRSVIRPRATNSDDSPME
jgi:putative ubiquitin-RnfH superfamily antitoxin RatB of RatAB toxin-antitoxin module